MRKKEVEEKIKNTFDEVPDVLDNILKVCEERKGFKKVKKINKKNVIEINDNKNEKTNSKFFIKPKFVGACAFAIVAVFVGTCVYRYNYAVDSIVEFDVNPSVELKINRDDNVIGAVALNEDGKKVLGDMDFDDVDLDVAINAIVGSMIKNGYLTVDENSILVSVQNNNTKRANELKREITEEVDEILKSQSIDGAILSQNLEDDKEIYEFADKNNISVGKAKLIKSIVAAGLTNAKGEKYTEEALSKLSINELNMLLSSKETKVDKVTSSGTVSQSSYISRDKAKSIAFENAGVAEANVYDLEVELDGDDGRLIYDVEFKSNGREFEYEIDAKSGTILEKEASGNDDRYDDVDDDYYDDDYDDRYDDDDDDRYDD